MPNSRVRPRPGGLSVAPNTVLSGYGAAGGVRKLAGHSPSDVAQALLGDATIRSMTDTNPNEAIDQSTPDNTNDEAAKQGEMTVDEARREKVEPENLEKGRGDS